MYALLARSTSSCCRRACYPCSTPFFGVVCTHCWVEPCWGLAGRGGAAAGSAVRATKFDVVHPWVFFFGVVVCASPSCLGLRLPTARDPCARQVPEDQHVCSVIMVPASQWAVPPVSRWRGGTTGNHTQQPGRLVFPVWAKVTGSGGLGPPDVLGVLCCPPPPPLAHIPCIFAWCFFPNPAH